VNQGKVYLVGAGPGDPGLITVKGFNCLKHANVIIYDHLVDNSLLDSARPDAEMIYVGKTPTCHSWEQGDINRLLVDKAKAGKTVVRLKGGDPFVLGRGGEEAEALARNQVPFQVVSGVSSAVAVPAYAGIPLTHRELASSFAVITGHEDPSKGESSIAWEKLATGVDTLVFLMGVANLAFIVKQLVDHGKANTTPVALIREGCGPIQETLIGTLGDIVARVTERQFRPPAVIVVGDVVGLRDKLRWFDNLPLFGKRILVTRARKQASTLSRLLLEHGAQPVEMPVIEIQALPATDELDQAITHLDSYQWIVFTSVNGVEVFFQRLAALNLDARCLKGIKIGAIGPATARVITTYDLLPDYVPDVYTGEGFLAGIKDQGIASSRFLLPRAEIADTELTEGISHLGAEVHEIAIYRTILPNEDCSEGRQMLLSGEIDMVTFTSSSTINNLLDLLGNESSSIMKARVACIGPKTAATAEKMGLNVDIVARENTIPGLVEAIQHYYQTDEGRSE
jgi:uroporphyrinogen III methyltransferase/synthase